MDALLNGLGSKESKSRAEALESLLEKLQAGTNVSSRFAEICARVAENIPENNPKACSTACMVAEILAQQHPREIGEYVDALTIPLVGVLGNAKPAARERATEALRALMTAVGPEFVMPTVVSKGASHKNWRVREGVLAAYAWQAESLAGSGSVHSDLLGPACEALADAQPDLRKSAADALAWIAAATSLAKVLAKVEEKGARPTQVQVVRDRYAEIAGAGNVAQPASAPAPAQTQPQQQYLRRQNSEGGGAPAGADKPPVGAKAVHARTASAAASLSLPAPSGVGAGSGRPSTPRGGVASATATTTHASASAMLSTPAGPAQLVGSEPPVCGTATIDDLSDEELCAHPALVTLTSLNSGPWWEPGIPNGGDALVDEVGKVRPLPLPSPKELPRVLDEIASLCANTTTDWKARLGALERLRGLVAGGVMHVDGFPQLVGRLREPLCAQLQDLRSIVCKQACTAAAELCAALGHTHWFEPLADSLVETLSKQTYVTIAVIATSAHACITTILHNTRVGFPRVLPKLMAGARTRSPVLRARCAEYLLFVLRAWPQACLERYADELQSVLAALLTDADSTARQCARLAYWSFISNFPAREGVLLSRLDASAQRLLSEDLPLARSISLQVARTPVLVPPTLVRLPTGPLPTFGREERAGSGAASSGPARATSVLAKAGLGGTGTGPAPTKALVLAPKSAPLRPMPQAVALPVPAVPHAQPQGQGGGTGSSGDAADHDHQGPGSGAYAAFSYPASGASMSLSSSGGRGPPPSPGRPAPTYTRPALHPPASVAASLPPAAEYEPMSEGAARELLAGAVSRLSAGDVDHKGVRDRCADLFNISVRTRALDSRSIVRAYGSGERVPPAVSLPASVVTAAHASMAGARASGGGPAGVPVPGHVSYPPLTHPTAQLDAGGLKAMLGVLAEARMQRGIRACLSSPHEFVVVDGLCLLSALLDTHADAYSLVVLGLGHACLGPGVSVGGGEGDASASHALRFPPSPLPVVTTPTANPSVTLAPVYARMVLLGPDADALEGMGGSSSSGPGAVVSDVFRSLFSGVLQSTSGATERVCSAGKRALACMRRAYPTPALLAVTLATLLTDATPRVQMVALHLIRDMLGDAGGAEYFSAEARAARLLGRVSDLLSFSSRGGGGSVDPRAPSSPFYGLAELVDGLVCGLLAAHRQPTLTALARLSPDQLRTIIMVSDKDVGGGGSSPGLQEAVFKAKQGVGSGSVGNARPTLLSAPAPAAAVVPPPVSQRPGAGRQSLVPPPPLERPQECMPVPFQPAAAQAGPETDLSPSPFVIPLTRANLELVLDTLAAADRAKQLRALHYFGRAVDVGNGQGRPVAPPVHHPDLSSPALLVPAVHVTDPLWLSLFDRVLTAVLNCVPMGSLPDGQAAAGLQPGLGSPAAGAGTAFGTPADAEALTMTQTALSVIRKLFRNCTGYVAGKSGAVFACLLESLRGCPRDLANVLERSIEEVTDRLPLELGLTHLVACLTALDGADAAQAVPVSACLRILTRLGTELPPGLLLNELAKGRLTDAVVKRSFNSTSTDVRRCVVALLVAVRASLLSSPGAYARYIEPVLTPAQAKLLQIYIDKADGISGA